jgi:hypothetical protein
MKNLDKKTIKSFGDEWVHFDQSGKSNKEVCQMMKKSGLEKIKFKNSTPFWTAVGFKKK